MIVLGKQCPAMLLDEISFLVTSSFLRANLLHAHADCLTAWTNK